MNTIPQEEQKSQEVKPIEHEDTNEIVCPHCGYTMTDSWEMPDSCNDYECDYCEETFSYSRYVSVSYTSRKLFENTIEVARQQAHEFCKKNPTWKPICDIDNADIYYVQFEELDKKSKDNYINAYGQSAKYMYEEFASPNEKCKTGFIGSDGKFYENWHNASFTVTMMVFEVGRLTQ